MTRGFNLIKGQGEERTNKAIRNGSIHFVDEPIRMRILRHDRSVVESSHEERPDPNGSKARRLIGKRAVAEFLGVTLRTVEKLQKQGLPFYKITPRRNGYFLDEVEQWLVSRPGNSSRE